MNIDSVVRIAEVNAGEPTTGTHELQGRGQSVHLEVLGVNRCVERFDVQNQTKLALLLFLSQEHVGDEVPGFTAAPRDGSAVEQLLHLGVEDLLLPLGEVEFPGLLG